MTSSSSKVNPSYVLGHSEHELRRLRNQARLLEPVTRGYLLEAGIGPGMRVLDVGSGAGDVAFLAAELVGETGQVIGSDRSPVAIATATQAAQDRGLANVEFREGDPAEMEFEAPFDAVVGRYVLPFQADPAGMLRGLARHLVQNGLVVFHEPDWTFARSFPPVPLYDAACHWMGESTRRSGQSWNFLEQANSAFIEAGLPAPTLRLQTYATSAAHAREWLSAVEEIIESLLPAIVKHEVATDAEVDLPTFHNRLWEEVTARQAMLIGRTEIGIWTRVG